MGQSATGEGMDRGQLGPGPLFSVPLHTDHTRKVDSIPLRELLGSYENPMIN